MSTTPVIIGLDAQTPGIGIGAVELASGQMLFADWFPISRDGTYEHQALTCLRSLCVEDRGWQVAALAIERVGGGRGIQSMLKVANCAGIVAAHAAGLWPEANLYRPTPGDWKKASGISGNANKDIVRDHAFSLAPPELRAIWDETEPRQDAFDAVLMAYAEWRTFDAATEGRHAA